MSIDLRKEPGNNTDLDLILNFIKNTNNEIIKEKLEEEIKRKHEQELKINKFEKDTEFLKPLLIICDNFFQDHQIEKRIFNYNASFKITLNIVNKDDFTTGNIYIIEYYMSNNKLCFGYSYNYTRDNHYSESFNMVKDTTTNDDEFIQSFIKKMLKILRINESNNVAFKKLLNYM